MICALKSSETCRGTGTCKDISRAQWIEFCNTAYIVDAHLIFAEWLKCDPVYKIPLVMKSLSYSKWKLATMDLKWFQEEMEVFAIIWWEHFLHSSINKMEENTEPISLQILFLWEERLRHRVVFILLTNYLMIIEP